MRYRPEQEPGTTWLADGTLFLFCDIYLGSCRFRSTKSIITKGNCHAVKMPIMDGNC